jgi:quinol-cytochrome oxidoreductase complex cytochrome b subunit
MNRFYGLRTRRTLSDDRIWYSVNKIAGIAFMISSVVYGVVAAVRPYDRQASDNFATWGIHLAAFVIPLIISIVLASRYEKRF